MRKSLIFVIFLLSTIAVAGVLALVGVTGPAPADPCDEFTCTGGNGPAVDPASGQWDHAMVLRISVDQLG